MSAKAQEKTKEKTAEDASKKVKKAEKEEKGNRTVTRSAKKEAQKRPNKKSDKKPNVFKRFVAYLKAVRIELKRVTWPTRREVRNQTITVLVALVFFGLLIYLVDTGIAPILNAYSQLGA